MKWQGKASSMEWIKWKTEYQGWTIKWRIGLLKQWLWKMFKKNPKNVLRRKYGKPQKRPYLHIIGIEEGQESWLNGIGHSFNSIIEEIFPKLRKDIPIQVQGEMRVNVLVLVNHQGNLSQILSGSLQRSAHILLSREAWPWYRERHHRFSQSWGMGRMQFGRLIHGGLVRHSQTA